MNYHSLIRENLHRFRGIIKDDDRVGEINNLLNEANDNGFKELVHKFCSQNDSDRAYDILFETWVCKFLLQNTNITNLQYEPSDSNYPPDFRFTLGHTCFDVQVKILYNIYNEIIKRTFEYECRTVLAAVSKPWFINYGISKDFERKHINPFFKYIKDNLAKFDILPSLNEVIKSQHFYYWPDEHNKLVSFSFSEKVNKNNNFISIGTMFDDVDGISVHFVPMEPIRESINRILKKARPSLSKEIDSTQSNLVIMKTSPDLSVDNEDIANILYGDEGCTVSMRNNGSEEIKPVRSNNGLFRSDTFSTICGLIFIPESVSIFDKEFKGGYFPHPRHREYIRTHPKPFLSLPFLCP